jgi:predicted  nucleic acid-binding Zn-ribbon protein
VLRKVIQDTNDRLKQAEENFERAEKKTEELKEKLAAAEADYKRIYDMLQKSESRAVTFEDRWKLTSTFNFVKFRVF